MIMNLTERGILRRVFRHLTAINMTTWPIGEGQRARIDVAKESRSGQRAVLRLLRGKAK